MNLLLDPLFRVRLAGETRRASLPELLALLGADAVDSLPGLQRHQEDAFHIFLCYLAGAVLVRQDQDDPKQDTDFWRSGIRALTHAEGCDNDDAWTLVVSDSTRPAFLQPPAPTKEIFLRDYKPKASTPDALDVMQTAKNHDIKAAKSEPRDMEAWCYALLSLQTQIGFLGAGNQGIARMNGGFGSRACVGWKRRLTPSARFAHDVPTLLSLRSTLLDEPYPYRATGKVLLWLPEWDGNNALPLSALDPFFIEIARRIRLAATVEDIFALAATASRQRVEAKENKGNLGDPWIPINIKTGGALTVPATGLTPELLRNLLFPDAGFTPAAMQEIPQGTGAGWFSAAVLVRGQGTTDGFHEAAIRIPERVRPLFFGKSPARDRLAVLSRQGLELASTLQYKILQPALYALMEGGPKDLNMEKREVSQWVASAAAPFAQAWHPLYFDWLWQTPDQADDTEALRPWFERLRALASRTLERAIDSAPLHAGRGYRAKVQARGRFFGALKKHFPDYLETHHEQS